MAPVLRWLALVLTVSWACVGTSWTADAARTACVDKASTPAQAAADRRATDRARPTEVGDDAPDAPPATLLADDLDRRERTSAAPSGADGLAHADLARGTCSARGPPA